ncbi:hypothetical protein J1614_001857 [Plenodomus biglobosus]|nr:hypothetical protein J1614_001857 [Plenodomus biglobosus]
MSAEFLTVDHYRTRPSDHRSRSSGYVDDVEERKRRDRRECERQMKRYHDYKFSSSSSSTSFQRQHQRSTSDYLGVPVSGVTIRNAYSNDNIRGARDEPLRGYNIKDVQPGPSQYDYNLTREPVLPSQHIEPHVGQKTKRHKRPAIRVEIHQDHPPFSNAAAGPTPTRSPSASLNSPTAQPELQYQYATLQNRLAQLGSTCATYSHVEAANPHDLTFAKIAKRVDGFAFDLQVWAHIICLNSMAKIDAEKRYIVEAAARNLDRLLCKVQELDHACARAKPRDLKFAVAWPRVDEEKMYEEEDGDWGFGDPTDSLAFAIHSSLRSIELQMRTLKRLARSLQEATPDAKEEVVAMAKLIQQTTRYFGSQTALVEYSIDPRFTGKRALDGVEDAYA